ncbi:MAG TPA: TonB family protein [Gemmatimonadaceae bacterium]|nr:TonB family protein [Gemmatimonadaceae bacterium]
MYEPPQTAARISLEQMRDRLTEMMVIECPRLIGTRTKRRGGVTIDLAVSTEGRVDRASIRRGSGDATFDDIAGGMAARLALAPPPQVMANDPSTHRLTVLYECAPAGTDVRLVTDSL